jgi:hypothetical protein
MKRKINKFENLSFHQQRELYAMRCDQDHRTRVYRDMQIENLRLKKKDQEKDTKISTQFDEIRDLNLKLKSRDERIEFLEEKQLHYEQNANIPVKFVQYHNVKKRKKDREE